jgi:hypothetical protein
MPEATDGPLACPRCASRYSLDERFCRQCEMPLVYVGRGEQEPITEAQERARKVKPQYVGGDQVKVAFARNLSEAELIQGLLLEEGIPSIQRRSRGFDVPDFLAAGPRDILVPQAAEQDARTFLSDARVGEGEPQAESRPADPQPLRLLGGVLIAVGGAALLVWILYQLAT